MIASERTVQEILEKTNTVLDRGFDQLAGTVRQLTLAIQPQLETLAYQSRLQTRELEQIKDLLSRPLDTRGKELRARAELAFREGWIPEAEKDLLPLKEEVIQLAWAYPKRWEEQAMDSSRNQSFRSIQTISAIRRDGFLTGLAIVAVGYVVRVLADSGLGTTVLLISLLLGIGTVTASQILAIYHRSAETNRKRREGEDLKAKISRFRPHLICHLRLRTVKFFESGADDLPKQLREYKDAFSSGSTRYVNWELDLDYPEATGRVDFTVQTVLRKEGGSVFASHSIASYVEEGWTSSWVWMRWGWEEPGQWPPGRYRVEFSASTLRLGDGQFEISPEEQPSASPPSSGWRRRSRIRR